MVSNMEARGRDILGPTIDENDVSFPFRYFAATRYVKQRPGKGGHPSGLAGAKLGVHHYDRPTEGTVRKQRCARAADA